MRKPKVLIIRFNSIGDIVLTSPVINALSENGYEIHYLCKALFSSLLDNNPKVEKVWELKDSLDEVVNELKKQSFDYVLDLHNNLRSTQVKRALGVKSFKLDKPRVQNWLLTNVGLFKKQRKHIVDRFIEVAQPLLKTYDKPKVQFFIPKQIREECDQLHLPDKFICINVGAAFYTKAIPKEHLERIIKSIKLPSVLIGGPNELSIGEFLVRANSKTINLVGQLKIEGSAEIISRSLGVVTGDTGMMHIAAALNKKVWAVFGSTHPLLGFTPYYNSGNKSTIFRNTNISCSPCTKQGRKKCPKTHFKCMFELDINQIIESINLA